MPPEHGPHRWNPSRRGPYDSGTFADSVGQNRTWPDFLMISSNSALGCIATNRPGKGTPINACNAGIHDSLWGFPLACNAAGGIRFHFVPSTPLAHARYVHAVFRGLVSCGNR